MAPRILCGLALAVTVSAAAAVGVQAASYPDYPCSQYPSYPGCTSGGPPPGPPPPGQTGPPPPGQTGPPPPGQPPPHPRPKISGPSSLGLLTPSANGTILLRGVRVTCPAGLNGLCDVTAALTSSSVVVAKKRRAVVVARTSFKLKPGRTSAIRVKLTRAGKKLLRRRHRLNVVGKITVRSPDGQRATKKLRLRLKQRPRRR